jgi:NADH:ubiquinone oxidoreductase subunit 2 (subunit N)
MMAITAHELGTWWKNLGQDEKDMIALYIPAATLAALTSLAFAVETGAVPVAEVLPDIYGTAIADFIAFLGASSIGGLEKAVGRLKRRLKEVI